jgi:lysyl-tRNA synthetase-like protein GenX
MTKRKIMHLTTQSWPPTATIPTLKLRAEIYAKIRHFFKTRDVLEVETPIMSHAAVTDPYIASIPTIYQTIGDQQTHTMYLHTSPEYPMKRLLAAGSGSIFQICKTFRNGETGRIHNPEFTMLEWYRIGFDHYQLIDEMDALLQCILNVTQSERLTYQQAFLRYVEIDPHQATAKELQTRAKVYGIQLASQVDENDRDMWLQLLMSDVVEPQLGKIQPTCIYDFPASQAALARIRHDADHSVAERFEIYFQGMELANGFHELSDVTEQTKRFEKDLSKRQQLGYPVPPRDDNLLSALTHGLPDCAGVALGIDRLIMLAANTDNIADVLAFPHSRA